MKTRCAGSLILLKVFSCPQALYAGSRSFSDLKRTSLSWDVCMAPQSIAALDVYVVQRWTQ